MTILQTTYNNGNDNTWSRHVNVEFLPNINKYIIEFSTTLDKSKHPEEHHKEFKLFLNYDELSVLTKLLEKCF